MLNAPQGEDIDLTDQMRASHLGMYSTLACVLLVFASLTLRLASPFNICNDCALYLEAGVMVCRGMLPLDQIWDTNPPLIIYLNAVPALISKLAHVNPIVAFDWFISAIALAAALLVHAVVRYSGDFNRYLQLVCFGLFFFIANFFLTINVFFGQREHILVMSYIPFFLLRLTRAQSCQLPALIGLVVGIFAGVGLCLKPVFFLLPVVQELIRFKFFIRNYRSPEITGLSISVLSYIVFLILQPEPCRSNFFDGFVFLLSKGYAAYNRGVVDVVASCPFTYPALMSGIGAVAFWKKNYFVKPLVVAMFTAYVLFVIQCKGFEYHAIPMFLFTFILICCEIYSILRKSARRLGTIESRLIFSTGALAAIAVLANLGVIVCTEFTYHRVLHCLSNPIAKTLLSDTIPSDSVVFLDTGGCGQYPLLLQTGRTLGTRYLELFPFACGEFIKQHGSKHDGEKAESLEQKCAIYLSEDINRRKPKIIIAATKPCWAMSPDTNFFEFLVARLCIKESLSDYVVKTSDIGFQILVRREPFVQKHSQAPQH